ncbi:prolipoprotein diacylglyceryl transferase [Prosthecochloris vibrioformis]|uniref:Phosphatidylglycerol--prolipoprotein diacylglyceryl transferase n=1 Tax=Prosthecochloris vibrioformis TaxID=1098 RepID=A0A5C4S0T9_PROVB|nr:prolipoprotein diacylglyceryl transferase [Prosthecochloris vibrioformis]TNJ37024.1 prolipoprotein diacylglyceryl transferase [Prosthecochloris vibrioformis]
MHDFVYWWQTLPYKMDPVIFTFGPLAVRWYGMMYIVAFAVVFLLTRYRLNHDKLPRRDGTFVSDALTWAMIGVLLGGRFGYLLFYGFSDFIANPIGSLLPFSLNGGCSIQGISGMSFHGGLIGVTVALYLFSRSRQEDFLAVTDLFIPSLPLGYMFGRLGNFINGELWGRVTESSIGMYFPMAPGTSLRHPSQLYEAFFEGIVLFVLLWAIRRKSPFPGFLSAIYLIGYATVRFFIEFYREPDAHLGLVFSGMSMGQLLCLVMLAAGALLLFLGRRRQAGNKQ